MFFGELKLTKVIFFKIEQLLLETDRDNNFNNTIYFSFPSSSQMTVM